MSRSRQVDVCEPRNDDAIGHSISEVHAIERWVPQAGSVCPASSEATCTVLSRRGYARTLPRGPRALSGVLSKVFVSMSTLRGEGGSVLRFNIN